MTTLAWSPQAASSLSPRSISGMIPPLAELKNNRKERGSLSWGQSRDESAFQRKLSPLRGPAPTPARPAGLRGRNNTLGVKALQGRASFEALEHSLSH